MRHESDLKKLWLYEGTDKPSTKVMPLGWKVLHKDSMLLGYRGRAQVFWKQEPRAWDMSRAPRGPHPSGHARHSDLGTEQCCVGWREPEMGAGYRAEEGPSS